MANENRTFTNSLNVDLFFQVWARIESERAGVRIIYKGKRLKKAADSGQAVGVRQRGKCGKAIVTT